MRTSVRLSDHLAGPTILPAPYAPSGLAITGSGWTEAPGTLMIYGSRRLAGLQYVVTSREIAARQIEPRGVVPSVITTQYGSYDGPDVRRLRTIAATHTVHAVTRLQQALDLQAWFRSASFRYSIKTSLPSSDWLLSFLTIDRKGNCRQFAWAYAVLARLLGIPSRIAVGYTGGAVIGAGRHEVTTADAHAWPELYFPGTAGSGSSPLLPRTVREVPPCHCMQAAGHPRATGRSGPRPGAAGVQSVAVPRQARSCQRAPCRSGRRCGCRREPRHQQRGFPRCRNIARRAAGTRRPLDDSEDGPPTPMGEPLLMTPGSPMRPGWNLPTTSPI